MKEILTIQIGPCSNYAGAHLWNALSSYANDSKTAEFNILFNHKNNPRTVIIDFKDQIGSLNHIDDQEIEIDLNPPTWSNNLEPIVQPMNLPVLRDFSNISDRQEMPKVNSWSDYLMPKLDKHSIAPLNRPLLFNTVDGGHDTCANDWVNDTLLDSNLRYFLEESDHPAGLCVYADSYGGWAGVTNKVTELVSDYVPKLPFLLNTLANEAYGIAYVTGSLAQLSTSKGSLLCSPIRIPDTWTSNNSNTQILYLASATLAPLFCTTLLPIVFDTWSMTDFTNLLAAAHPACPLTRATMYAPFTKPISNDSKEMYDKFFFQTDHKRWVDFGFKQPTTHGLPDAEAWMELNARTLNVPSSIPQWTPMTDRTADWYGNYQFTFPRKFPYPYQNDEDGSVAVHYLSGINEMSSSVQWMAKSVLSNEMDLKESLMAMIDF